MKSQGPERLIVVLPAYNEADNIGPVVEGVLAQRIEGVEITALVVNDGSRDQTAELALAAGATVISHPRNRGVGAGFRTGLVHANSLGADYLIHMDSDGQFHSDEIPLLLAPVRDGHADMTVGSRFLRERPANMGRAKARALTGVARLVGRSLGHRLTDLSCGFRCMNRSVMRKIWPTFDYDYIQETLIQAMLSDIVIEEVPVTVEYPEGEQVGAMSNRPLRYGTRFLGMTAYALWKGER